MNEETEMRHLLPVFMWCVALSGCCATGNVLTDEPAQGEQARPLLAIDDTLVMRVLTREESVRDTPSEARIELSKAMADMLRVVKASGGNATSPERALVALKAMHEALCALGYRQPMHRPDWTSSIGKAFGVPYAGQDTIDNCSEILGTSPPPVRYLLDCDMGAQIMISVGQMLGWDLRLVNVPDHSFMAWHLNNGDVVNWDWSFATSKKDEAYRITLRATASGGYGKHMVVDQAQGYYLAVITDASIDANKKQVIFDDAFRRAPFDPSVQNNYVWFYVTNVDAQPRPSPVDLVGISLASIAVDPNNANRLDTLACAYAAAENKDIAVAVLREAIRVEWGEQQQAYQAHLEQIERGESCVDSD